MMLQDLASRAQVEHHKEQAAAAILAHRIIEIAARDVLGEFAEATEHSFNSGSPSKAERADAVKYFRNRDYALHAAIAGLSDRVMEIVRTAVLEAE